MNFLTISILARFGLFKCQGGVYFLGSKKKPCDTIKLNLANIHVYPPYQIKEAYPLDLP